MGEEEEEEDQKEAVTTQFDIVRSDRFLRDGGLLPGLGLGRQHPAKRLCRRLAMLGGSQRPNWPFFPGPTRRERAQALLFDFTLKSSFVVRRERKSLSL